MDRRFGVIVTDAERLGEALRVAVGISALDDRLSLFLLDVEPTTEGKEALMLEMLGELGHDFYATRTGGEGFVLLSPADLSERILECDHVVTF